MAVKVMSANDFSDVNTVSGLAKLNTHMATHSYVVGHSPTQQDVTVWDSMEALPSPSDFPHAARWFRHLTTFARSSERGHLPGEKKHSAAQKKHEQQKPSGKAAAAKPDTAKVVTAKKVDDDDDFDVFGEETAEEVAQREAMKAAVEGVKEEKKKKIVINKSQLVIDVKPSSVKTDMEKLENAVRGIKMEGLEWSVTCKVLPVAFGLMKLQIGCVIIDDLVDTEDIIEKLECLGRTEEQIAAYQKRRAEGEPEDEEGGEEEEEDEENDCLVQSAEIVSFNKL